MYSLVVWPAASLASQTCAWGAVGSEHTNFLFGSLRFLLLEFWRILNVAVDYLL